MSHPHNHSHGCNHEASDIDENELGIQYSLFEKIDMKNLQCLNEELENSGQFVFKPYEQRFTVDKFVDSDVDEELLFNIPFTGNVKLKGFCIIGPNDSNHPNKIKLYKNRPKMTFDDTSVKPDAEYELQIDTNGSIEYPTKVVQFSSVHHLSLYFPSNFGDEKTRIYYIGLKGEFFQAHHHGVTICNYEARPNVADHKNDLFDKVNHQIH